MGPEFPVKLDPSANLFDGRENKKLRETEAKEVEWLSG